MMCEMLVVRLGIQYLRPNFVYPDDFNDIITHDSCTGRYCWERVL